MGAKQFRCSGAELPRHVGIDGLPHPNAENDELLKMRILHRRSYPQMWSDYVVKEVGAIYSFH